MTLDPILIKTSTRIKEIVLCIIHPLKGTELEGKLVQFEANPNDPSYNQELEKQIKSTHPTLEFLLIRKIKPLLEEIADNEKIDELFNKFPPEGTAVLANLLNLIENKPNLLFEGNIQASLTDTPQEEYRTKMFLNLLHSALNVHPTAFDLEETQ
ncbi:MAG: hypothetical protein HYY52_00125 [Candidatus Melainabacteria bacterium]|nr:hypothetical protein [Candidatus Melainabacteria bacterium]